MEQAEVQHGDCREILAAMDAGIVHCCVTSPPYYGLRDYGHDGQIGLEPTPDEYVARLVEVFREVRRVLREDGTLWLNLGDSYAGGGGRHSPNAPSSAYSKSGKYGEALISGGIKPQGSIKAKDLIGIPWRVAFALQADGWYLRQDIIWAKPNPMPESVTDRCTKAHEYVFLLSKSARYFYDQEAVKEPSVVGSRGSRFDAGKTALHQLERAGEGARVDSDTRNRRSVWTIATKPYAGAHFAVMPPDLAEPCILAGCPVGGLVIDPFTGSGTVGMVAVEHGRRFIGAELNAEYVEIARERLAGAVWARVEAQRQQPLFGGAA